MQLPTPVQIPAQQFTTPGGNVVNLPAITLSQLRMQISDDVQYKLCNVFFRDLRGGMTLWSGEEYDAAGDYTQADIENRILELLGSDPAAKLAEIRLPTFSAPRPVNQNQPAN